MAKIIHPECLEGKYCNLREVTVEDAEFILFLRCNSEKSKYLNPTENNIEKQREYIKRYLTLDNEWYFLIEDKKHNKLGVHRIYNVNPPNFTTGSWLMIDDVAPNISFESIYLIMNYAFNVLGLKKNCYDVRKENKKVVQFNKFLGAKIVGETEIDYLYETTKEDYRFFKKQ